MCVSLSLSGLHPEGFFLFISHLFSRLWVTLAAGVGREDQRCVMEPERLREEAPSEEVIGEEGK